VVGPEQKACPRLQIHPQPECSTSLHELERALSIHSNRKPQEREAVERFGDNTT
jgi:hypothetical protein